MGDHRSVDSGTHQPGFGGDRQDGTRGSRPGAGSGIDPLALIEQCLESFSEEDPRRNILYKLRHAVMLEAA
jgi:proteasome-associated ATPase